MLIVNLCFQQFEQDQQFCHVFSTAENVSYNNICDNMFEPLLKIGYFSTLLPFIFQELLFQTSDILSDM